MNLPAVPMPAPSGVVGSMIQSPSASAGAANQGPALFGGLLQDQKLELLEYWRTITKRKWAILSFAAAAAVLAALVSLALTPIYRGSATVLIEGGKAKILSIEDIYGGAVQQREHYQTQVEILKSREVALRTARELKLWDHPAFDPRKPNLGWRARLLAALGIGEVVKRSEWTESELADATVKQLMSDVTITPVRMSQLVYVHYDSADRQLAAKVANTLAHQYIQSDRDERYKMAQQVSQQLQERMQDLRAKLEQSERALQDYREKKGIVSLGGNAQASTTQQVAGLTDRMLQARTRRMEMEASYAQARATAPSAYGTLSAVVRDPGVIDAQRQLTASTSKLAELSQRLGPEHMQVKQAQAEVADLKASLARLQQSVVTSMTRDYEAARATELSLERGLNTAKGAVQDINREEFQLAVLDREYQSNRQLYEMFMSRAKETDLMGDVQASVARVVDAAVPPETAIKPQKTRIVLASTLLALLLGALSALALDRLDNTIKGGDDAEARLRLPLLAALPEVSKEERARIARLVLDDAHSHFAEGIRTARTGVLLASLDVPKKILLVTSTLPGEGKTTVAINLALAHAQTMRTLLIDCDLRRAQVTRLLRFSTGTNGLTSLVAGRANAQQCISLLEGTGLSVLPVGDIMPNPLELLLSQRFKDTLAELSDMFEMIIIDSPPVELVSEALVLTPMATSTILVVKAMSTPAPLVRRTQQRLVRAGGHMLGVIVNHLDFKRAHRYYGEYTYSSYSYGGYGYGLENDGKDADAPALPGGERERSKRGEAAA